MLLSHYFPVKESSLNNACLQLDAADITAVELHSDLRQTGRFSTSSWILNKIQNNTVWGQKDNLMSVPTDCDQRDERRGWMGDAALTAEEATCAFLSVRDVEYRRMI